MISSADIVRAARELYRDGPFVGRRLQQLRPYICPFELLVESVPPGSRLLDIGCGSGLFLGLLARFGRLSYGYGFDIGERAISQAMTMRNRLPRPDDIEFAHRPADAPWPQGPFDVVSMIDVMHHIDRSEQTGIFPKVAAALKPGGVFIYKDMVSRPAWRAWANRAHDALLAHQWIHYLPRQSVVQFSKEAGMTVLESWTANRLWYGHEFMAFRLDTIESENAREAESACTG